VPKAHRIHRVPRVHRVQVPKVRSYNQSEPATLPRRQAG